MRRYTYRSTSYRTESEAGCAELLAIIAILLIPAAIISVLGNIFFPQFHFTFLGGYGIVIALRHLRGLLFIGAR